MGDVVSDEAKLEAHDRATLRIVDALRRRGAIEMEIPAFDGGGNLSHTWRLKFAAPLASHVEPVAGPPEAPPIPHTDAPDCRCPSCETAFGSAD